MKRYPLSLLAVSGVALLLSGDGQGRGADMAADGDGRVAAAAGQILNLDPATGNFTSAPISPMPAPDEAWLSTSDRGLVVEASPVRGGGYMVDLQGRFQNTVAAVIDTSGALRAECVSASSVRVVK